LQDLLKHEYDALRFLPQASYEQAAQMRVSPAPDVVTRIFMLFRGVAPGDLDFWEQAAARATAEDGGAAFWKRIVGIDLARASDRSSFRVLEWVGRRSSKVGIAVGSEAYFFWSERIMVRASYRDDRSTVSRVCNLLRNLSHVNPRLGTFEEPYTLLLMIQRIFIHFTEIDQQMSCSETRICQWSQLLSMVDPTIRL
jgi:hypothetical protein